MDQEERKNSGDKGGFWAASGDLLLGISVLFVMVILFATLRVGVLRYREAAHVQGKPAAVAQRPQVRVEAVAQRPQVRVEAVAQRPQVRVEKGTAAARLAEIPSSPVKETDARILSLEQINRSLDLALLERDRRIEELNSRLTERERAVRDLKAQLESVSVSWEKEKAKSAQLAEQVKSLQAQLAARGTGEPKVPAAGPSERRAIASDIQSTLRGSGVEADVNPESGVITLKLDGAFRFHNASYELTDGAKDKLRKLMPVYASSLLGGARGSARIASVSITGHASPRFHKKFVDPHKASRKAYLYNLDLSVKRAQQVAEYVFGDGIGNYAYKDDLRSRVVVAGKGYAEPIALAKGKASAERCAGYDCAGSRRVEISFTLASASAVDAAARPVEKSPADHSRVPASKPAAGGWGAEPAWRF